MIKEDLYELYLVLVMRFYRPRGKTVKDFFKKFKFREKIELADKCRDELKNNVIGPNTIKVFYETKHIIQDVLPCECDPYLKIYECPKHEIIRFLTKFENLYILKQ